MTPLNKTKEWWKMVSKEVEVDNIWNDNCWFKINEGVDCDCQELLEEGLSSPCERYLIENEKNVVLINEFVNLNIGSSFNHDDKEFVVHNGNNSCKGCYFEYRCGVECDVLQRLGMIPYCSQDDRTDNKSVIFVEKTKE